MNKKTLSIIIVLLMVLSVVPVAFVSAETTSTPQTTLTIKEESPFTLALEKAIQKAFKTKSTVRLIVAPKDGYEMEVYDELKQIGKVLPISMPQYKFVVIEVTKEGYEKLKEIGNIERIWIDKEIKLPEPPSKDKMTDVLTKVIGGKEKPEMFWSIETTGAIYAWQDYGVYGENVTVAVIDTGIDPIHPFLQTTMDGRRKIIDWKDFTLDGYVDTESTADTVVGGYLQTGDGNVYIGDIASANGVYHYGWLMEGYHYGWLVEGQVYDIGSGFDFNGDGDTEDSFFVLVVNSSEYYDTVYVDTDGDLNLTDEVPLHVFSESGDTAVFEPKMVGFVLADLDPEGDYLWIGWDNHGHGTHVAGIVAGYNDTEEFYGMAPNAQIMALKVFPTGSGASSSSIIAAMIYATIYGPDWIPFSGDEADIITMSLGLTADYYGNYNDGTESAEGFYVNYLADKFGVVFTIAAGNEGPGVNRISSPGDASMAITVGAMFEGFRFELIGYTQVPDGVIWFSNRGPRMDGLTDPDVVAPGWIIFSSVPVWYSYTYGDLYPPVEGWAGTSMATPHVAGAAALLISYAKQHNLKYDPIKVKEALMFSAKKLDNQLMVDQGFGLIQVDKAIELLQKMGDEDTNVIYAGTTYTTFTDELENPIIPVSKLYDYFSMEYNLPYLYRGIYARNEIPATVPIYVYSLNYNGTLQVSTDVDWILPSVSSITVSTDDENGVVFYITIDKSKLQSPGIYEGMVYIDDPNTDQIEAFVPVTVVVPLNNKGQFEAKVADSGVPEQTKHYFFNVPEGTQKLEITFKAIDTVAWGYIYEPTGYEVAPYIYFDSSDPEFNESTIVIENPKPGVWEIGVEEDWGIWDWEMSGDYEISVKAYSVTMEPEFLRVDLDKPGAKEVTLKAVNEYADFNASVIGMGLSKLDESSLIVDTVTLFSGQCWEAVPIYVAPDSGVYYLRVVVPEMSANANIWFGVDYYDENGNYIMSKSKWALIGPNTTYAVDFFMPESGYYVIWACVDYIDGSLSVDFTYGVYILDDTGNITVDSTPFKFSSGESRDITAGVNVSDEGTYIGVIGIKDFDSGVIMGYVPIIVQVGQPEMSIALSGSPKLGEPTLFTLKMLDKATLEPVKGKAEVIINGQVYYAEDGELKFYYAPLHLKEELNVKVIGSEYRDVAKKFALRVSEPEPTRIIDEKTVKVKTVYGVATIDYTFKFDEYDYDTVTVTMAGNTGETAVAMVTLPYNAYNIKVVPKTGEVTKYWIEKGTRAIYVFVEVQFHSAVTFDVQYRTPYHDARNVQAVSLAYYLFYTRMIKKFDELYNKSVELGIDNETLQEALNYKQLAVKAYEDGLKFGNPYYASLIQFPYFRRAYLNIKVAVEILEKAIGELESS